MSRKLFSVNEIRNEVAELRVMIKQCLTPFDLQSLAKNLNIEIRIYDGDNHWTSLENVTSMNYEKITIRGYKYIERIDYYPDGTLKYCSINFKVNLNKLSLSYYNEDYLFENYIQMIKDSFYYDCESTRVKVAKDLLELGYTLDDLKIIFDADDNLIEMIEQN